MDDKAVWAVRGPRRRSGSEESEAARERLSGANSGAWRRVAGLRVIGFLGFGRERSGACLWFWFRQAKLRFA